MDRDDQAQALEVLGFAVAHRRRAEQELAAADQAVTELVAKARAAGLSWQAIADALGRKRQNVERAYRPRIDERRVVTVRPSDTAPAAHYQVAGSVGGPGECGVECACGVAFNGFDTFAEAAALLDGHITAANSPAPAAAPLTDNEQEK